MNPHVLTLGTLNILPATPTLATGSGTWTLTGSLLVGRVTPPACQGSRRHRRTTRGCTGGDPGG